MRKKIDFRTKVTTANSLSSILGTALFCSILAVPSSYAQNHSESDKPPENKQAMATSAQDLVNLLQDVSFMPPEEYKKRLTEERGKQSFSMELKQLPQILDESSDPRATIKREEVEAYATVLTDIALESKNDGNLLWGRIQGTKYERKALKWIESQLNSFGIEDVRYEPFPSQFPQWTPTRCDLIVTSAPGFKPGQSYNFKHALTAFTSKTTPLEGIEKEVVFVGEGTAAELSGRDLSGKIVLLRGRTMPNAVLSSARVAYSRIATGTYGKPEGIIVWWDVPKTDQVAGRVGATGGGDDIGKAVPWTSIGDDAGMYLRKLLDRATPDNPVKVKMNVQGHMEYGDQRISGNAMAYLPGKSKELIIISSHVDGYFYGIHDNGASVALNLALANYYAQIPEEQRQHSLLFLYQGDHEVPGVGGTLPFVKANKKMLEERLMLVLRPEHLGLTRVVDEGVFIAKSNVTEPLMLTVTNRSPVIADLFKRAANNYNLAIGDLMVNSPAGDEAAFHPPFNDIGAISAGWMQGSKFYHSTADVDWQAVDFDQMEKFARGHAFIIDELFKLTKKDLQRGAHPDQQIPIYKADLLQLYFGNH